MKSFTSAFPLFSLWGRLLFPLISFLIISAYYLIGCNIQTINDPNIFYLRENEERGNPLDYKFTVTWGNYSGGYIYLMISPGPHPGGWYIGSINSSQSQITGSYTFPDNYPSPTSYTVYAELRSSNAPGYTILKTSNAIPIEITFQKFNYIKLSMVNDDLWPYSTSPNYSSLGQAIMAFGDANVVLRSTPTMDNDNLSNTIGPDGNPLNLSSESALIRWAVMHAYGSFPPPNLNLQRTILCGIDDFTGGFHPDPPNGFIGGITLHHSPTKPSISFVLYSRIRSHFSSTYDRNRVIGGCTIHELGHAIGIVGHEGHSGSHSSTCVMRAQFDPNSLTDVYFCNQHLQDISNFNWFIE